MLLEAAEMELRQHVVDDAVLEVRHPVPDLHGDDDRHRPDEDEPRAEQQPHRLADADEEQRDQQPEHHRQPDVRGGEDDRADERVPEDLVVQDRPVVGEPDADALVADQLEQAVPLQREPDEVVERVPEDQRDRDDDRRDQRVRDARPAPRDGDAAGTSEETSRRRLPYSSLRSSYGWFSTEAMLSLADCAACFTVSFPVRICASMLRRMLPFSTSTQCFAVGTNQLREAARSLTLLPEQVGRVRDVALRLQGLLRARGREVLDPVGRERLVAARDRHGEVGAAEEARHRGARRRGRA